MGPVTHGLVLPRSSIVNLVHPHPITCFHHKLTILLALSTLIPPLVLGFTTRTLHINHMFLLHNILDQHRHALFALESATLNALETLSVRFISKLFLLVRRHHQTILLLWNFIKNINNFGVVRMEQCRKLSVRHCFLLEELRPSFIIPYEGCLCLRELCRSIQSVQNSLPTSFILKVVNLCYLRLLHNTHNYFPYLISQRQLGMN